MLAAFLFIFHRKYFVIRSFHNSALSIEKYLEHPDMRDANVFVFVFVRNGANLAYSSDTVDANRI
jgi:hypothetical protein